jgi:hypothetical protein
MALVVSGILAGLFHHLVHVQDLPTLCPVAGLNARHHRFAHRFDGCGVYASTEARGGGDIHGDRHGGDEQVLNWSRLPLTSRLGIGSCASRGVVRSAIQPKSPALDLPDPLRGCLRHEIEAATKDNSQTHQSRE